MKTKSFILIRKKANIVKLYNNKKVFGKIEEITSKAVGAQRVNVAKVTLWGPDILHYHKKSEETYICLDGKGEIFINGKIFKFVKGVRVIIKPKTIHAARPKKKSKLVFLCVASPAFSPDDVVEDPRQQNW